MKEFLKLCKDQLETSNKVIEIIGDTLEECLTVASENLNLPREEIDYQIISKAQKFFFYKTPYHIRAFSVFNSTHSLDKTDDSLSDYSNVFSKEKYAKDEIKIQNGEFFIEWNKKKGVSLKVTAPETRGKEVILKEVEKALLERGVEKYDKSKVSKCVQKKSGKFIHISNMETNQTADYKLEIDRDNVKATLTLKKPLYKEANLTLTDLEIEILSRRIITPINKKEVQYYLDNHIFSTPFTITEAKPAIQGKNAYIKFHVEIHKKPKFLLNSELSQINYKELNLIENVSKDQLLAEKIEAIPSQEGSDLFGNKIYAEDGKDLHFEYVQGKGTYLDKKTKKLLYSSEEGQVIYGDGKLKVEPIYEVHGDVGPKTGNIDFNGSVIVNGNILDNYSVKSKKSIEIKGTVQKAKLEAQEDIIIQGGCSGKSEVVSLKESVFVKFIQSSSVDAHKNIVVSQGIINSNISAGMKIICVGKKSSIIGGFIKVKELIITSNLGSDTAPKTIIEMGYSPVLIKEKHKLEKNIENLLTEYKKLKKDIKATEERKKADPLSFDQEEQNQLASLKEKHKELEIIIKNERDYLEKFNIEFVKQGFNSKLYIKKSLFSNVHIFIKKASISSNSKKKLQGFYFEEATEIKFQHLALLDLQEIINSIVKEK